MPHPTHPSAGSPRRSLVALALWAALGLALARVAVAFSMDHLAHGMELATSVWRVGRALGATLLAAVLGGAALALAARLAAGAPESRGSQGSRARALAGLALGAAAALWVLSGLAVDLPSRVPGTSGARAKVAWLVLAGASALAALAARAAARRGAPRGSRRSLALPVLLGAALWLGLAVGFPAPAMRVMEVARAVLEEQDAFEVASSNPSLAPVVGALTPATDWRARGGERTALLLAPGGDVRFRVRPEDGPVKLQASVGIDRSCRENMRRGWREVRFRFDVWVDGELAFEHEVAMDRERPDEEYEWQPVEQKGEEGAPLSSTGGGERWLVLRPGAEVRLVTSCVSDPPDPRVGTFPWAIGFSDLLLVRERERKRKLSSPDHPSLVLVLQDTQRADRLGCYGGERGLTPHLDALAARGLVYEAAHATSSWTWPSTTSVLTGLAPAQHGVQDSESCYAPRGLELLSEALQAEGYTTAAFSGSPLIAPAKNFDQGFETFVVDPRRGAFVKSHDLVPRAVEWLRTWAGQRFFLYLHLVDPHEPHRPRPEDAARFCGAPPADLPEEAFADYNWRLRHGEAFGADGGWELDRVVPPAHQRWFADLYDACTATGDHWVGELLGAIDALGLSDETVVAFTSDHGEELFDHGMLEHGHTLHPELVDVPLILAGPGIPAGERCAVPVSNRHLAATLARIGGARLAAVGDGLDLARPALLPERPVLLSTRFGWWNAWHRTPIHGLQSGSLVLHWAPEAGPRGAEQPPPGGEHRLYDLDADPGELRDVAALQPERARALRASLEELLGELEARRAAPALGGGAGTNDLLEGIGYIQGAEDGTKR